MSRSDVRLAVAAFLAGAGITGLARVYKGKPTLVPGELMNLVSDSGSGAIAWVHLAESDEDRWALPAQYPGQAGGIKAVHYIVSIFVYYQYLIPSATQDTTVSPDDWVDAEDAILQGIKDRIHSDPQLGTGPTGTGAGTVFTAAQEQGTLKVTSDEPLLESGKVFGWHAIDFRATEVIRA